MTNRTYTNPSVTVLVGCLCVLGYCWRQPLTTSAGNTVNVIKGEIDNIWRGEKKKKLRLVKQDYYDAGPKATRLLAK